MPEEQKKLPDTGDVTIDMKEFKSILEVAIKDSVGTEVEDLKKQMADVQSKALFKDEGDEEGKETFSGSIIDSSFFKKDYADQMGWGGI